MRYGTALSFSSIFVLLSASAWAANPPPPDPTAEGSTIAQSVQSSWCSSSQQYTDKLSNPLMSPVEIYTLDGKKKGNAQILCPGSKSVVELFVQPGSSGDLTYLMASYDSNLDGSFDGTYSTNKPISGTCANGVVSCQPGTWVGCRYYQWKYDGSKLFLEEVISKELGGCFCFNDGCTAAPFAVMRDQVLTSLAGGIATALAKYNPRFAVTKSAIDGYQISLIGQSTGDCSVKSGDLANMGFNKPESIYGDTASLNTLTTAELSAQQTNPDSFYYMLTHSTAFQNVNRDTCKMERDAWLESWCNGVPTAGANQASGACGAAGAQSPTVVFNWQVTYKLADHAVNTLTGTTSRTLCTDHLMFTRTRMAPDGKTVYFEWAGTDPGGGTIGWNCGGIYNDWIVIDQATMPEGVREWDARINITYSGGGCNTGSAISTAYWCMQADELKETLIDQCQILAKDPNCRLEQEKTFDVSNYGVLTVFDFSPTGVIPTNTCKTLTGTYSTQNVCHDWWKIERTYVCKAEPITIDSSRQDMISSTLKQSGGDFTYTDLRTNKDGTTVTDAGSITIDLTGSAENCIKVCKLLQIDQTALSNGSATTADYRLDATGTVDIYRTCTNNTCEVRAGETIVRDCGCINEFGLAYGVMETARQGGIDMTCSDGAPKKSAF